MRIIENATLIRTGQLERQSIELSKIRPPFIRETQLIPLEFLIKDRCALVTATSIPRFAEHPLDWVGFPSTEKTYRKIFRIFVQSAFVSRWR